jgi:aminoglycoside phosphotransferase (APT) family kinase protein
MTLSTVVAKTLSPVGLICCQPTTKLRGYVRGVAAPVQRDPDKTAADLTAWLRGRFPDAGEIVITKVHAPPGSGFSGETLLLDTTFDGVDRPLVVRVAPTTYTVFLEPDFEGQYRVMKTLSEQTDVPMPTMLALETDPSVLGATFSLMDRIDGEAPTDAPPYTQEGWLKDATPEQQAQLLDSGLRAMAAVQTSDWRALGLDFVRRDPFDYLERYYAWALAEDPHENPIMERTMAWLRANKPADLPEDQLALCWGDARPGNQLFKDFEVVAVLDWEMVEIGDPIMDLAWWQFLDRYQTSAQGIDALPGFPSEDEVIARWSELTGRTVVPDVFRFYLLFAGARFGVVMMRLAANFKKFGLMPEGAPMAWQNPVLSVVERELDAAGG